MEQFNPSQTFSHQALVQIDSHWLMCKFLGLSNQIAVIDREQPYTYLDLYHEIQRMLEILFQNGIAQGEIVSVVSDYSFQTIAMFLALMLNQNIVVPLLPGPEEEIKTKIKEAYSDRVMLFDNGTLGKIHSVVSNFPKHPLLISLKESLASGLILYSSGTTGKPKAMLHNLDQLAQVYEHKPAKPINILMFLLFDHIGGIDTLFRALSIGATLTLPLNRDPDYIAGLIERHNVNVLPASPSFLNLLLFSQAHLNYRLDSLQIIGYGAEPMPETLLKRLQEAFPKVMLQQKFGTSETNAIKVTNQSPGSLFMKFDDPNITYKIVEGELWLKSKTRILGYLNHPADSLTDDGWFKTGDLVEVGEAGFIKIVGRINDLINVGGEKVYPYEVEQVLLEMPEVLDCLVYGESNPLMGQTVVADIVLKPNISKEMDIKLHLKAACKNKLEPYKIPTKIRIVDTIEPGKRLKRIRSQNG